MQDWTSINEILAEAEDYEFQMKQEYSGKDYLEGVIATLNWVLFGGEEPVNRKEKSNGN